MASGAKRYVAQNAHSALMLLLKACVVAKGDDVRISKGVLDKAEEGFDLKLTDDADDGLRLALVPSQDPTMTRLIVDSKRIIT